jgi:hypothetical protein
MVGYLVWATEHQRPVFEPARGSVSDPMLSKLKYFIDMTEPASFEGLQSLRSDFWSFVPIDAGARQPLRDELS